MPAQVRNQNVHWATFFASSLAFQLLAVLPEGNR